MFPFGVCLFLFSQKTRVTIYVPDLVFICADIIVQFHGNYATSYLGEYVFTVNLLIGQNILVISRAQIIAELIFTIVSSKNRKFHVINFRDFTIRKNIYKADRQEKIQAKNKSK